MGTELIGYEDKDCNILLKRYWGGTDRGVMYQITMKDGDSFVSLNHQDMIMLCHRFLGSILND